MSGYAVRSKCPTCGVTAVRETYDIGSGPELSCSNCEWCWGAEGQDLKPYVIPDEVLEKIKLADPEGYRLHFAKEQEAQE